VAIAAGTDQCRVDAFRDAYTRLRPWKAYSGIGSTGLENLDEGQENYQREKDNFTRAQFIANTQRWANHSF
jgi:hypothetical protein